jgi:hypothetical protein
VRESELPVDPVRVDTMLENPHPLVIHATGRRCGGINCRAINVKCLTLTHLTLESVDSRWSYDATDGMPGLPRSILGLPGALSFTATTRGDTLRPGWKAAGTVNKRERERQTEEAKNRLCLFLLRDVV